MFNSHGCYSTAATPDLCDVKLLYFNAWIDRKSQYSTEMNAPQSQSETENMLPEIILVWPGYILYSMLTQSSALYPGELFSAPLHM